VVAAQMDQNNRIVKQRGHNTGSDFKTPFGGGTMKGEAHVNQKNSRRELAKGAPAEKGCKREKGDQLTGVEHRRTSTWGEGVEWGTQGEQEKRKFEGKGQTLRELALIVESNEKGLSCGWSGGVNKVLDRRKQIGKKKNENVVPREAGSAEKGRLCVWFIGRGRECAGDFSQARPIWRGERTGRQKVRNQKNIRVERQERHPCVEVRTI